MEKAVFRRTAAITIGAVALLHVYVGLIELEEYFGSVRYIGALFLIGAAAGFIVAVRLWNVDDQAAWAVGALIAGGMALGFILSRTVGLPDFDERGKWELEGLISLALEGGYLALFFGWASGRLRAPVGRSAPATTVVGG
jgi:di/tricarboxylate transporter